MKNSRKKRKYGPRQSHKSGSDQGVAAKKHLGQHFLKDLPTAERIAATLNLEGYDHVLEIGPGTGVLTRFLLRRPIHLYGAEIDSESADFLEGPFREELKLAQDLPGTFELFRGDFLKMDLSSLFPEQPFAITGNFPYNISSQIVFKVIEHRERIPEFSGMFQKEVAERICADPGSKAYGILSVLAQAYYQAEYLFTVPPDVFSPPPKVDSGVIRLTRLPAENIHWAYADLKRVVKTAFNQRRKTLRNSLKSLGLSDNLKEDTIFDRRPEQLTVSDFIALTKSIANDTL